MRARRVAALERVAPKISLCNPCQTAAIGVQAARTRIGGRRLRGGRCGELTHTSTNLQYLLTRVSCRYCISEEDDVESVIFEEGDAELPILMSMVCR